MRIINYALALVCAVLLSCSIFSQVPPGEANNIESVSIDDEEMNAAIQKAQDALPLFIQAFQSPKPTQTYFSIKARFPYGSGDEAEHIWIDDLILEDNQFDGLVGNEPIYIHNIQIGDRVTVQFANVTDWMIVDDDRLLGGFTIYVLRDRMPASEREQFDEDFGLLMLDEPALP